MTIKKQLNKIMIFSGIMGIIHLILGVLSLLTVNGIGIGLGSLFNVFNSIKIFLYSREIVKKDESFKENIYFILKYIGLYFIGVLIMIIGFIIAYFLYRNYLNDIIANVIHKIW